MSEFNEQELQQAQAARDLIKSIYDDGVATINGRDYEFLKMRHQKRVSVFAFFTSIQSQLQQSNLSFLDTPQFKHVFGIICDHVTFDGSLISKLPEHFDNYPSDFVIFVQTALGVMSHPFLPEKMSDTRSESQPKQTSSTSKKVI